MNDLIARARGLETRLLDETVLAEGPSFVERAVRMRLAEDLAILARWSGSYHDELGVVELDEDRRSLRALVRGLAGGVPSDRRRDACVPTARLPDHTLARLADARHLDELAAILRARAHPLAAALHVSAEGTIDLIEVEAALAQAFADHARQHATDRALRLYVAQIIDTENAIAALELATRGGDLEVAHLFVPGGERLGEATFVKAATSSLDRARELLADVFARTPLSRAVFAPSSAIDDAALAWQLTAQRALRRTEPHGFAAVLHLVLHRRDQARRLRRAAWRTALGGAR